jgi:tetratricopeptide (TPR) repeat protein
MLGTWGYLSARRSVLEGGAGARSGRWRSTIGLAEAHTSLGYSKFRYDWDWPGAQQGFARAIALNPNDPTARQFYAEYLIVSKAFDEALVELNRAQDLDPLSLYVRMQAAIQVLLHAPVRRRDPAPPRGESNGPDVRDRVRVAVGVYREKGIARRIGRGAHRESADSAASTNAL